MYSYLLIIVFSVIIPVAFSLDKRVGLAKEWKAVLPALVIPAIFFLIWDSIFTSLGVWGFSQEYTIGVQFFGLPLEEILFFFAIPYCCLFTYKVLNYFRIPGIGNRSARIVAGIWAVTLIATAIVFSDRSYTMYTFVFTSIFLLWHLFFIKRDILGKVFSTFLVILLPFFIVNGLLTWTGSTEPIVWYNDHENLGIRLLSVPIEDVFYGFLLVGSNITLYELIKKQ